jgi:hypothetical protein
MKKLLMLLIPVVLLGQTYPAHPRLWKAQIDYLKTVGANPSSPDYPLYQKAISEANLYIPCFGTPTINCGTITNGVVGLKVTNATHGFPTILTVQQAGSGGNINTQWGDANFAVGGIGAGDNCWNASSGQMKYVVNKSPLVQIVFATVTGVQTATATFTYPGTASGGWTVGNQFQVLTTGALVHISKAFLTITVVSGSTLSFNTTGYGVTDGTYTVASDPSLTLLWTADFAAETNLQNLTVAGNVATVSMQDYYGPADGLLLPFQGAYLGAQWIVAGSSTSALNGTYTISSLTTSSISFATSGVADGEYARPGVQMWWTGYSWDTGNLYNIVVTSATTDNVTVNFGQEVTTNVTAGTGTNVVTVASATGIAAGQVLLGTGGTKVVSVLGTAVTLSAIFPYTTPLSIVFVANSIDPYINLIFSFGGMPGGSGLNGLWQYTNKNGAHPAQLIFTIPGATVGTYGQSGMIITSMLDNTDSNHKVPQGNTGSINYVAGNSYSIPWLKYHSMQFVDSTHVAVGFDSSSCSDWSGTGYGFPESLGLGDSISYPYEGAGWIAAAYDLALAYQLTGNATYATRAADLLTFITNMVSVKNYAMIGADSGYPSRNVWPSLAVIYDWCYAVLSSGQKAAAVSAVKSFYNDLWLVSQGLNFDQQWVLTLMTDCNAGQFTVSGASWSGGSASVTINETNFLHVGDQIQLHGVVPSGYNGSYRVTAAGTNTMSFALASSPGSYTSGGQIALHCPYDLYSWLNEGNPPVVGAGPPAGSNYWGGHVTGMQYMSYAIAGDDAAAPAIMADADAQFDFQTAAMYTASPGNTGFANSGLLQEGYGYGNRNQARLFEGMIARNYTEGINLFSSTNYVQKAAKAAVYSLRPDGWRGTPEWDNTGDSAGVFDMGLPGVINIALSGVTEGGWMQWLLQHVATVPLPAPLPPSDQIALYNSIGEQLLWTNSANTAIDYTAALPTYLPVQPGDGHAFYRSDWTSSGIWESHRASAIQWGGHNTQSAGNVEIQRGQDYLLPSGGQWRGCDGYFFNDSNGCQSNQGFGAGYYNTLYFWDNAEGHALDSGGTTCADYYYYGCQSFYAGYDVPTPISTANANYVYSEGNIGPAYHGKNALAQQVPLPAGATVQYVIRGHVAMGDGTFVVWDRSQMKRNINDVTTGYQGNVRWHMGLLTATPAIAGNVISNVVGSSKIYIASFLPSGATPNIQFCDMNAGSINQQGAVTFTITNITWASGVATVTYTGGNPFGSNFHDTLTISGVTPSGWNGTYSSTIHGSYTQATFNLASSPGAYTSGGTLVDAPVGAGVWPCHGGNFALLDPNGNPLYKDTTPVTTLAPTCTIGHVTKLTVVDGANQPGNYSCNTTNVWSPGVKISSRAEVSDPTPSPNLNVLTVLYATSSGGSLPTTTALATIDSNHIGVLVADTVPKVAVFSKTVGTIGSYPDFAATSYNNVTYSASYSASAGAKHVVANLFPSQPWTATRNGSSIASGTTDTSGTAFFTDTTTGGAFVVNQSGAPALVLAPTSLAYTGTVGGSNPANQTVAISASNTTLDNWSATKTQAWLTLSPTSNTVAGNLTVSINITGLGAGTFTDTISVASTTAGIINSPQVVAISLTLSAGGSPTLVVIPSSRSFACVNGGSDPSGQTVAISGTNVTLDNWSATKTQAWLSLSPTSGSSAGTLTISTVGCGGLSAATYTDTVSIASTTTGIVNTPQTVAITLVVTSSAPTLTVSPSTLTYFCAGVSNPAAQNVAISGGGGTLSQWSATKTQSWVSLSPAGAIAPGNMAVSITGCGSLSAGVHTDTITVSSTTPGVIGSPQTVSLILNVAATKMGGKPSFRGNVIIH